MYIESIKLKNFRSFSEEGREYVFNLGKHITCISGHNGIGKSTILAVLSNCGELKTSIGRHLNGDAFRGEYSILIKGEEGHDTTGEKAMMFFASNIEAENMDDVPHSGLSFRAAFQKYYKKNRRFVPIVDSPGTFREVNDETPMLRYRLIPRRTEKKKDEKKLNWPTYYLGLSRLYPVGESNEVRHQKHKLPEDIDSELKMEYRKILSMEDVIEQSEGLTLSDATNKKGMGVRTAKYSYLANSSGQDNLGQILLSVLSFQNLKQQMGAAYRGGILLIDEVDATLHPAAQNKLFDYMYKKAKLLNLQIVFTTHSLSLISHIQRKHELNEKNKSLSLLYLKNSRNTIEIEENVEVRYIGNT